MGLRSRGWHTVRQSAPTVWLRCPRDQPEAARGSLVQELVTGLRAGNHYRIRRHPPCPYGIAYRRVYGLSTSGLFIALASCAGACGGPAP